VTKGTLTRPTDATVKRLYARSGNRCAFPKCPIEIVQGDALVGEICHIKAARPGGPRYDPKLTPAERHGYDNLILLCSTHHTVIDQDEEAYTVDRLIKMKTERDNNSIPLADDRATSGALLLVNQLINTTNQSGGITAQTVNIYGGQIPHAPAQPPLPPPFPSAQSKDGPARFRAPGEPLGSRWEPTFFGHGAGNSISLVSGSAIWLRLMPVVDPGGAGWTSLELREALRSGSIDLQPFIWSQLGVLRAQDGVGCCNLLTPHHQETNSVAFAFETSEIWAIDTWLLATDAHYIVAGTLEQMYTERLPGYGRFLARLGLQPPYQWIAGLAGVKGRHLQYPPPSGQMRMSGWIGPECLSDPITSTGTYDGTQSATTALLPFFNELYRRCGMPRPEYLPR
jgi:hypothetical protein